MIRNYLSADEFLAAYPIKTLTKGANLPRILGKAAAQVGQDLRSRGNRRRSFQVPIHFDSALNAFAIESFTVGKTSDSVVGYGASRFVVDCTTAPSADAVFALQASNDDTPDGNTIWFDVIGEDDLPVSVTVQQVWQYAVPFVTQGVSYRYVLTTDVEFSARVYLVDGATDTLVMLKALQNILLPLMDGTNERIELMHKYAESRYDAELTRLTTDYDTDDDQVIESTDTDTRQRVRYLR